MTDNPQDAVPLSHALGTGTQGQPPRAQPSLKALAARVLEGARESVPLSHAIGTGTVGQAVASSASAEGRKPSTWDASDWQAFFHERAGIAEHDGGLSRADAEQRALECCIIEWMNRNPPTQDGPDRCVQCNEQMVETDALPFLTGDGGHVWIHDRCHSSLMERRRADAREALAMRGLTGAA